MNANFIRRGWPLIALLPLGSHAASSSAQEDIAKRHYFDNSQLCFFATYQGIGCNHF